MLCTCCDKYMHDHQTVYFGYPTHNALSETVCYDCARRYAWVKLESFDCNGNTRRIIDSGHPVHWRKR